MLGVLLIVLLLIGRFYPGSGAEVLDWKPTRSPEVEAENELDDIAQMLEATNERRARRGREPLTEDAVRAQVAAHDRDIRARREADMLDEEVESALAAKNERRRARGLPEMSLDEYKRRLGVEPK